MASANCAGLRGFCKILVASVVFSGTRKRRGFWTQRVLMFLGKATLMEIQRLIKEGTARRLFLPVCHCSTTSKWVTTWKTTWESESQDTLLFETDSSWVMLELEKAFDAFATVSTRKALSAGLHRILQVLELSHRVLVLHGITVLAKSAPLCYWNSDWCIQNLLELKGTTGRVFNFWFDSPLIGGHRSHI